MLVQLCTARAGYGHSLEERDFLAADWSMPKDERLQTRFHVYKDLRQKGFYLTSAGKFGGDYLVYPGEMCVICRSLLISFITIFYYYVLISFLQEIHSVSMHTLLRCACL